MNELITDAGITVTPYGCTITRILTLDEWKQAMGDVRQIKHAYHAVLSDLTAYGRDSFGDETVADALEQLEFEWAVATKAAAIATIRSDLLQPFEEFLVIAFGGCGHELRCRVRIEWWWQALLRPFWRGLLGIEGALEALVAGHVCLNLSRGGARADGIVGVAGRLADELRPWVISSFLTRRGSAAA